MPVVSDAIKERRDDVMKKQGYKKLNLSMLREKKTEVISFDKSLRGISPINWSKDVSEGRRKIEVSTYKR